MSLPQMISPTTDGASGLAAYAVDPRHSRGRVHDEPDATERTPHQRDRDRILHSGAWRRLQHKTQVFVYHEGDYYRTRLTHSLEVAQIARSIARSLRLNEDLAETLALAHDLGHPPFGHAGEDALDAAMAPWGGFDHNEQTVRVLTVLEQRYAAFDGLNPTWETIEGVVKHNGPVVATAEKPVPPTVIALDRSIDLQLDTWASAEAQVAALADDVAYNAHDVDDGLRAGLFTMEDLADLSLMSPIVAEVRQEYGALTEGRLIQEIVRRLIGAMVGDVLSESRQRLTESAPDSPEAVRSAGRPLVSFSPAMARNDKALKGFLFKRMYRHYKVNRMASKARRVVRELFELFMEEPNTLPPEWVRADGSADVDDKIRARLVGDYVAGMTDRYAMLEHDRLFDKYART